MATYNQILRLKRRRQPKYTRTKSLFGSPQRKGVCVKVYTTSPKKPNSAVRKVAKVLIHSTDKHVIAAINGIGHNLSNFSHVLVRGGRVRDIPGVHYKLIRGKFDFSNNESIERGRRRSKYCLQKKKF